MSKKHYWKFVVAVVITALIAGVGLVPNVSATTPNPNIVVDCTVNLGTEWNIPLPDESMGAAGGGFGTGGYLTWDSNNLYLGFTPGPLGNITIYIDTVPGGMQTASWGGTHQLAASGGYEFAYTNSGPTPVIEMDGGGGAWVPFGSMATFCLTTGGSGHIEWAIPWGELGVAPPPVVTPQVTVLITSRFSADDVAAYWPNVGGNVNGTSPSFVQGFIFPDPLGAGMGSSPFPAPTAISLSQITANSPQMSLLLLAGVLVLGTGAFLLLRRRNRKQEI